MLQQTQVSRVVPRFEQFLGRFPTPAICAGAPVAEPDPAERSAGARARQPRFAGSDRQGRGRLVEALCLGSVSVEKLAVVAGWPDHPERARRVTASIVADGLAVETDGVLTLP
jgi:A/G-specific adenine glycosylase